jgi:hypothetical protein
LVVGLGFYNSNNVSLTYLAVSLLAKLPSKRLKDMLC